VECAAADALDPDSLAPVLENVHTAYYLVHSMAAGSSFGDLDLRAAANFRDAAAQARVQRIIYLGGLIPKNPESVHLQSRYETGTPRWVFSLSPPIALPDLLSYLVSVADLQESAGKIYDAAGPDLLSYADVMRKLAKNLTRRIWIIPVPVLTPKLSSYWLRLVTTVPVNIARALVDGLKHDVPANDSALRAIAPIPLHNVDEAIVEALNAETSHDIPAHWVEGSIRCRNFEPRYAYYAKQATGSFNSSASPTALWREQLVVVAPSGRLAARRPQHETQTP